MSADLMLVNKSRGEYFEGDKSDNCVRIDETSMGMPHTDFGIIMQAKIRGFMGMSDEINDGFINKVSHWYDVLEHKPYLDKESIIKWLEEHKGEELEMECW